MSKHEIIDLSEEVVLITGAAGGLGRALSQAFAAQGAHVIINYYKSAAAAERLAKEFGDKAIAIQADVRDAQAVQAMVSQAQSHFNAPISTLVNNALHEFTLDWYVSAKVEYIR